MASLKHITPMYIFNRGSAPSQPLQRSNTSTYNICILLSSGISFPAVTKETIRGRKKFFE